MHSADESATSQWGFDWLTNFDFDRDGIFKNNKANWEQVDSLVANPTAAAYANWRLRPTMYTAAIEYMEGTSKSLTMLYHVYHAKEERSIHDWERIEIHVDNVTGTPSMSETIKYVTITQHDTNLSQLYGHRDLNFMNTTGGRHAMIWQGGMMQRRTMFLLIGGLPLLAYPSVFLAGVMSLAGEWRGNESAVLVIVVRICLIGSMGYPLIYVPCAVAAVSTAKKGVEERALKISKVPLLFLVVLGVLFFTWAQLD